MTSMLVHLLIILAYDTLYIDLRSEIQQKEWLQELQMQWRAVKGIASHNHYCLHFTSSGFIYFALKTYF